jgi:hypothetical protein
MQIYRVISAISQLAMDGSSLPNDALFTSHRIYICRSSYS